VEPGTFTPIRTSLDSLLTHVSVACDVSQIEVIHFLVGIVDGVVLEGDSLLSGWSCVGKKSRDRATEFMTL
jgi:hypothetical protein